MHSRNRLLLAATLAGGLSSSAFGQAGATPVPVNQYQGNFTGHALAVQLVDDAALTPYDDLFNQPLRIRHEGVASNDLTRWGQIATGPPAYNYPNFSVNALYAHWVPYARQTAWQQNDPLNRPFHGGFSSGGDVCPPVREEGGTPGDPLRAELMTDQPVGAAWYCLSVVLDRAAEGVEDGLVEEMASGPNGTASGHIFSYYVEGSTEIDPGFVDTNRIEYLREQMNLPQGPTGQGRVGVSALDWGIGTISTTQNGVATAFQPQRNCFYFTLTADWLALCGPQIWPGVDADEATIYVMTWNGLNWSPPAVAFDHIALFGSSQNDVEIDGIAVHHEPFNGEGSATLPARVVFSLTPDSRINGEFVDQILISQRPASGIDEINALPLATEEGTLVSAKLGLRPRTVDPPGDPDNVRGLCGRDPKEQDGHDFYVGYPSDDIQGAVYGPENIGLSLCLHDDVTPGMGELLFQVSGIDVLDTEEAFLSFDWQIWQTSNSNGDQLLFGSSIVDVPVELGSLTAEYEAPQLWVPPALPSGTFHELRIRARLHVFDVVAQRPRYDVGSSWTSVIRL